MAKIFLYIFLVSFSSFAAELKSIDKEAFLAQNPSSEREALITFLVKQFENKSVSQKQLDKLWNNKEARAAFMMARFQIVKQKLYADTFSTKLTDIGHYDTGYHYFFILLNYLKGFLLKYKVPDVDFIVYMREEIPVSSPFGKATLNIPSFLMFQDIASIYEQDKLLLPDPFFLKKNWGELLEKIALANKQYPWHLKIDKLFWRGATTGNFLEYNLENFAKLPRLTAVILSHLYPNLIDAEFSSFPGLQFLQNKSGKALKNILDQLSVNKKTQVSEVDHLQYKYLLSIDGNAATGTRVPWIMYSSSVLVKQESTKIEWFYPAIKPYVHYIPINERLTDIFTQLKWLKSNDEEVKLISANAHNFVKNELMPEHIDSHVAIILNEYHKIQQDKEVKPTLPEAGDMLSISNATAMIIERKKNAFKEWKEKWF